MGLQREKGIKYNSQLGTSLEARRMGLKMSRKEAAEITGLVEKSIYNMEKGMNTSIVYLQTYIKALGGSLKIDWPPLELYPWKNDYYKCQKNKKKED